MKLAKGSLGFQVGAQQVDLVLLVMNESGVQKLLQNKMTLGVDAAVAAGPIGRQASVATDAQLQAEILSYSRAEGLFAGIDLSGGILRPDEEANKNVYGPGASRRTILASREISAPPEAAPLLEALAAGASPTTARTTPAAPGATPPAPASVSTASMSELRARIADMQRTIDELLSESRPVGTTGSVGQPAGTMAVERARLVHLRHQLDQTDVGRRTSLRKGRKAERQKRAFGRTFRTSGGRYLRAVGVRVVSLRSPPRRYATLAGWPIFRTSSAYV